MKWGSRYGPEFVNRLYASIQRHTKRETKVYCFTDDESNINNNVICKPLPDISLPKGYIFFSMEKNEFMAISSLRFRG